MRIESSANFLSRFQNKARITIFSIPYILNKSSSSAFRPALANLWLLLVLSFLGLASERNSTNPAIWLVSGAGGISSYGPLQWAESVELIYFPERISGYRQSFALFTLSSTINQRKFIKTHWNFTCSRVAHEYGVNVQRLIVGEGLYPRVITGQ